VADHSGCGCHLKHGSPQRHLSAQFELKICAAYLSRWKAYKITVGLFNSHSFNCLLPSDPRLKLKLLSFSKNPKASSFFQKFSQRLRLDFMAFKGKQAVSSSNAAVASTTFGGSPPQEATISGK